MYLLQPGRYATDARSPPARRKPIDKPIRRTHDDGLERTFEEYLVLKPDETADPFTVRLEAGTYSVRWHSVVGRETREAGAVKVEDRGSPGFPAPFAEASPSVLYLKRDGS